VRRLLLVGGVAAALVLAASAYAAFWGRTTTPLNSFTANSNFCTASGTSTVSADHDTYIMSNAATNQSALTTLLTQSDSNKIFRILVHFVMPAINHNCVVTSATLTLTGTATSAGRTLTADQTSAAWTDTTVTWANQPGTSGSPATAACCANWANTWNVTTLVAGDYGATGGAGASNGFLVKDANEGTGKVTETFSSREGANPPQLTVVWG
jgi:hypothetical protein